MKEVHQLLEKRYQDLSEEEAILKAEHIRVGKRLNEIDQILPTILQAMNTVEQYEKDNPQPKQGAK